MRKVLCLVLLGLVVAAFSIHPPTASSHDETPAAHAVDKPALETLLKAKLEGVAGTEVIVSRVSIPANTSLPKHWHPGEEFAYVLEGTVVLWQKDKDEIVAKAGDALMVPLHQVHTAITRDEAAILLVFRVHEEGQPERVLVE